MVRKAITVPDFSASFTVEGKPFIPDMQVEPVTPATAESWLEKNFNNRTLSRSLVKQYARDMASDNWLFTGAPIVFSETGTLLDGQKRLAAVIDSGKTVWFMIARNVPEEYRLVIDSGQRRSPAHALQMEGLRDANQIVSTVRLLIPWTERRLLQREPVSPSEIGAFVRKWEDELYSTVTVAHQSYVSYGARNRVAAALFFRAKDHFGEEFTQDFFDKLITGEEIPKESPISAMRRNIQRAKNQDLKLDYLAELYYGVRSLNAAWQEEPLSRMQRPRTDWTEEHFDFVPVDNGHD